MPLVSVIVPCYNEEKTIVLLLDALLQQDFQREEIEVIIADGNSSDATLQKIASFQADHPGLVVRVVKNLKRTIPAGLNLAIREATGQYIIRLDAHSHPYSNYITLCIADLQHGKADNVGGIWEIHPGADGTIARAIAIAAAHPLGVGDALYRYTEQAAYVDTVPFGAFKRELFDELGFFNEALLSNEDYEFNTRIIRSGRKIWLNPSIRSVYYARADLGELANQYKRYGFWKARMLVNNFTAIRMRQVLPPLFVASLILLPFLGLFSPIFLWVLLVELILYLAVLFLVGFQLAVKHRNVFLVFCIPLAMAVMHVFWGGAFLYSIVGYMFKSLLRGRP